MPPEEFPLEQFDKLLLSQVSISSGGMKLSDNEADGIELPADVNREAREHRSEHLKEEPAVGDGDAPKASTGE